MQRKPMLNFGFKTDEQSLKAVVPGINLFNDISSFV